MPLLPSVVSEGPAPRVHARRLPSRSAACRIALLGVVALLTPVLGLIHPALNWDVLPYVAIVQSWAPQPPVPLHRAAYADVEAFADAHGLQPAFRQLTERDPYRRTVASDAQAFRQQLPFYRIRPLYAVIILLISRFTATVTAATVIVSFAATLATNLVIALMAARRFGIAAAIALLAVFSASPFVADVAHLCTPDALLTAAVVCAMALLVKGEDLPASVLLFCAVFIRSDTVLLNLLLAGALALGLACRVRPRSRGPVAALAILGASIPAERMMEHLAGNYGYGVLYRITFEGYQPYPAAIPPTLPPPGEMARFFLRGVYDGLTHGELWVPIAMALLLAGCLRGRFLSRPGLLLLTVVLWIAARFVLFPSNDTRFLTPGFAALSLLLIACWPVERDARGSAAPGTEWRPRHAGQPDDTDLTRTTVAGR